MIRKGTPSAADASRFLRSVNVEHDLGEPWTLDGYLITAGVRQTLQRIAQVMQSAAATRVWTITGTYGTGKSALALFTANVLAGEVLPGGKDALKLLQKSDPELARKLRPAKSPLLLPITVTGAREPLHLALLRGLKSAATRLHGKGAHSLNDEIDKHFSEAQAGKVVGGRVVGELFSRTLDVACAQKSEIGGIFLIIDELGKLLEYAAAHPAQTDIYTLQILAEAASRSSAPFLILGILHANFSLYADRLSATERAEWDKVGGRFENITFDESDDEVLRLIAEARQRSSDCFRFADLSEAKKKAFRDTCQEAWRLGLAPGGVGKKEFLDLVEKCWPLHPLVSLMLGPLFRRLAQNERSVFSFLESREPRGLCQHLESAAAKQDCVYRLDDLYDYLMGSIGEGLYLQMHGKRWAEIETVLAGLHDATPLEVSLVKIVGVFSAIGQWRNLLPTEDVLTFALDGTSPKTVHAALAEFRKAHHTIKYRRYNKSFALWQGSDVNIDEQLKIARGRIDRSVGAAALATRFLQRRPIVAKRHSFEKGSLRYFTIRFITPDQLDEVLNEPPGDRDGQLLILASNSTSDAASAPTLAKDQRLKERGDLLLALPTDLRALEDGLHELACLDWVKTNTPELEGDETARIELRAHTAAIRRQIEDTLDAILSPSTAKSPECTWYCKGKPLRVTSRRGFQECLSDICDDLYPSTPLLRNELLNRRELSSSAAAARRNLIEFMINHAGEADLGISGTPPEKSMYLSLLKATGIHRKGTDGWHFGTPPEKHDPGMHAVWRTILEYFRSSEQQAAPLPKLYDLLSQPPFGLKAGPLPVLFCAALLANDDRVALYEEGSFVPQFSVTTFERLLRAPERFAVQQWRITGVRVGVFHRLTGLLSPNVTEAKPAKAELLSVVRRLCRFAKQLNEYASHTEQVSETAQKVRSHLLSATKPDRLLFEDLPQACGMKPFGSRGHGDDKQADVFVKALRNALEELHHCYDKLLEELTKSLGKAFDVHASVSEIRAKVRKRADVIKDWVADPLLKAFVLRLTDSVLGDVPWLESVAGLIAQKPPARWRDEDHARYEVALVRNVRLFNHMETLAFARNSDAESPDSEAIRVGVTTKNAAEAERVVFVSKSERQQVDRFREIVRQALADAGVNGQKNVAIAAMARVLQEMFED